MRESMRSREALMLCVLLIGCVGADGANGQDETAAARIALTKFDVNDTTLELGFQIRNDSDHDIWVCETISWNVMCDFEAYLAEDHGTLVIRRRHDVPTEITWYVPPIAKYSRMRPGES